MEHQSSIEVITEDGWRKIYPLEKPIIYLGSHSRSDIILEGKQAADVAPLHAQLIANGAGYQLINLADAEITLGTDGRQTLAPHSVINLTDGMTFMLGHYTLVFHGGQGAAAVFRAGLAGSRNIGLSISLPQTQLAPNQSLEGVVTVHNKGPQTGAQFELELEGMDPDCYDIEPGPLLSSGGEKEVLFRLHHRGAKPLAGDWEITIRTVAPRAYPGEQAAVSQLVTVLPAYRHKLRLLHPNETPSPLPVEEDFLTPKAKSEFAPQAAAQAQAAPAPPAEALWKTSAVVALTPPPTEPPALKLEAKSPPAKAAPDPAAKVSPEAVDLWDMADDTSPPLPAPVTNLDAEAVDLWGAPAETELPPGDQSPEAPASPVEDSLSSLPETTQTTATRAALEPEPPPAQLRPRITPDIDVEPRAKDRQPSGIKLDLSPQPPVTTTTGIEKELPPPTGTEITPSEPIHLPSPPTETETMLSEPVQAKAVPQSSEALPQSEPEAPTPPAAEVSPPQAQAEVATAPAKQDEPKIKRWLAGLLLWLPFYRPERDDSAGDETEQATRAYSAEYQVEAPPPITSVSTPPEPEPPVVAPAPVEDEQPLPVGAGEPGLPEAEQEVLPTIEVVQTPPIETTLPAEESGLLSSEEPASDDDSPVLSVEEAPEEAPAVEADEPAPPAEQKQPAAAQQPAGKTQAPAVDEWVAGPEEIEAAPVQAEESNAQKPAAGLGQEEARPAETGAPSEMEDWWATGAESEEMPPPEVEEAEDWWATGAESEEMPLPEAEKKEPLKLGVSPVRTEELAEVETSLPPETDDWWTAGEETTLSPKPEKKQVIKLKASSRPAETAHTATKTDIPPEVDDWWSAEAE